MPLSDACYTTVLLCEVSQLTRSGHADSLLIMWQLLLLCLALTVMTGKQSNLVTEYCLDQFKSPPLYSSRPSSTLLLLSSVPLPFIFNPKGLLTSCPMWHVIVSGYCLLNEEHELETAGLHRQ